MKTFRPIVFWCHLVVGAFVASVVIVMSATGVLLTYQRQMTAWADTHGLDGGPPADGAPRLDLDALVARVTAAGAGTPTAVTLRADPSAPVEIALGRGGRSFVNGYTGAALGSGSPRVRAIFRVVTAWHRTLGATGESRALGRSITGLANLGFFFLVLSGLFLWWPRTWTRARLRNIAVFRRGATGKARDFNWHNTLGLWSVIPLVVIVGSGVVMSYPWANALVYRAVGERPPQPQTARTGSTPAARAAGQSPRSDRRDSGTPSPLTLDAALAIAQTRMPDWRSITLQLPSATAPTLTASLDAGSGGQPQRRGSLAIDRATGAIDAWQPFWSQTPGRRLRSILRFAHTGEVLGVAGQTIAGLVSLSAVLLAYTGLALAVRRLLSWRRRRARAEERTSGPDPRALDTAA